MQQWGRVKLEVVRTRVKNNTVPARKGGGVGGLQPGNAGKGLEALRL